MSHEDVREMISAFALDALGPAEIRRVEAHLRECEECRQELEALREVTAVLARGVAPVAPPAALRGQVASITRARPQGRRAAESPRWALAGLAVAAALIVVLGTVDLRLSQRLATLTTRVETQEQVLALLSSPSARTAVLSGSVTASVRLVYDPARARGALVVSDLRDPGSGLVYQLWLITGKSPQAAGVFRPAPGQPMIVPVIADFRRYQIVAVTVERGPLGAQLPTSTPILVGNI
jgi:anti-sigma factor RsiW